MAYPEVVVKLVLYLLFGLKQWARGFPGGAVLENPPANAGDIRFHPWSGKIPHAAEQLSPCTTSTERAF